MRYGATPPHEIEKNHVQPMFAWNMQASALNEDYMKNT
jgi:hypothetical protein